MNPDFLNPLEMLPIRRVPGLTAAQIRGEACPWCGGALGGTDGISLGARIRPVGGRLEQWFPRACRPCVLQEAERVAQLHDETCGRCSRNNVYCPDGFALHKLARGQDGRVSGRGRPAGSPARQR